MKRCIIVLLRLQEKFAGGIEHGVQSYLNTEDATINFVELPINYKKAGALHTTPYTNKQLNEMFGTKNSFNQQNNNIIGLAMVHSHQNNMKSNTPSGVKHDLQVQKEGDGRNAQFMGMVNFSVNIEGYIYQHNPRGNSSILNFQRDELFRSNISLSKNSLEIIGKNNNNMKNFIVLSVITLIITSFSLSKRSNINYDYIEKVDNEITKTIKKMKLLEPYHNIKNFDKKLYVEITNEEQYVTMVFNSLEVVSKETKDLIKKSNRFIILPNLKIPIVFSSDTSLHNLKEKGVKLVRSGYIIKFNIDGDIVLEGLIQ